MKRNYKILNYKEGMKITKPCIIRGMPNEVYHKMPALSNSGLKTLLDCPSKYYYKYLSGEYIPKEKPYFKIGKAAHSYILEGRKKFLKTYWTNPYYKLTKEEKIALLNSIGYDGNLKSLKVDEINELLFELNGIEKKEIELTPLELNQVILMARAINNDTKAKNALSAKGESELSLFWQDEKTGVWLKCRPDFLPYDCKNVPDYKTTDSAKPELFYNSFFKYGYFVQAAMYRMGIKAVCDIDVENFFFIVQEKEAPYVTQIYNPEIEGLITWGEKVIYSGLEKYLECKKNDLWEGYFNKIIEIRIETKPDDLIDNFDRDEGIIYAPYWLDKELCRYGY